MTSNINLICIFSIQYGLIYNLVNTMHHTMTLNTNLINTVSTMTLKYKFY